MNKKGFTLLELLVVVLIIGILAAIALPQYRKAVIRAKFAEVNLVIDTTKKNIQSYLLTHGEPKEGEMIFFTGSSAVGEIPLPGNCDEEDSCETDLATYILGCDEYMCTFNIYLKFLNNVRVVLIPFYYNGVWDIVYIDGGDAQTREYILKWAEERGFRFNF